MKFRCSYVVFLSLFGVSFSLFSQEESRIDSIYVESRNTSNVLELNRKYLYSFDNGGVNPSSALILYRQFGMEVWNNQSQVVYAWNENNEILSSESYSWNGTDWSPAYRSETRYNENGLRDTIYSYAHDGADWYHTSRNTYIYNVNNKIHQEKAENYSEGWINSTLNTMSYDGLLMSSQLSQRWNGIGWDDYSRNTITYNDMDLIETLLSELWDINAWINYSDALYSYTVNGLLDTRSQRIWNSSTVSWDNYLFVTYTYNEHDYLSELFLQLWQDIGNGLEWVNQTRNTYYRSELLDVEELNLDSFSVFPNPFVSNFTIRVKNPLKKSGKFKLYTVQGKLVYEGELMAGTKTLNYSNPMIAKGLYIGIIESGSEQISFKLIRK